MEYNKEILVSNMSRLSDIQHIFSSSYPFLKIEFMTAGLLRNNRKLADVSPGIFLSQLASIKFPITINISNERTVAELTYNFEMMTNVAIQILRKSGNVWNIISVTEGWTLESQNAAGEFISTIMANAPTSN